MNDLPLFRALKHLQYRLVLSLQPRTNHTYTQFYRFHHQYLVLTDRVLPHLLDDATPAASPRLEVVLFGCSTGAEPYSLSSVLLNRFPHIAFLIRAFDFVPEVVAQARLGLYTKEEVYKSPFITEQFIRDTFVIEGDQYRVQERVAAPVIFDVGNILDAGLFASLGKADLVFAQNMLFHLKPAMARVAFVSLAGLLKPRSALFVDGMDTQMRIDLTKQFNLAPVDFFIEEVHHDAFIDRGNRWASRYWGREPFSKDDPEWVRKYCTVYLRDEPNPETKT
jgi:chemotaxis methyl-accepting protein methylase